MLIYDLFSCVLIAEITHSQREEFYPSPKGISLSCTSLSQQKDPTYLPGYVGFFRAHYRMCSVFLHLPLLHNDHCLHHHHIHNITIIIILISFLASSPSHHTYSLYSHKHSEPHRHYHVCLQLVAHYLQTTP